MDSANEFSELGSAGASRSITNRPKLVQPGEAHAMIAPGWFHCLVGAKHGSN
jgi:hypothetical protein